MADEKPIVIIKKKGGHGGHHGGAWKIAYADFVTAMMCFFLVMWLVNSAEVSTRQAIASYFRRPGIFSEGSGTPLQIGGAGMLQDAFAPIKPKESTGTGRGLELRELAGTPVATPKVRTTPVPAPSKEPSEGKGKEGEKGEKQGGQSDSGDKVADAQAAKELGDFDAIAAQIKAEISKSDELAKLLGIVDVKVEADGLNIEIMDTEKASMFTSGSATILPQAREAFSKLSELLKPLPNKIDIVGHTDAKPFSNRLGGYSNWELSADRANAARKVLEASGIGAERITSVVGRAEKELRNPKDPLDASNRRITLKMRFNFTHKIDLSKDSDALKHLDDIKDESLIPGIPAPSESQVQSPPAAETTPAQAPVHSIPVAAEPTPAGSYKPKKLIKAAEKANQKVALPDEEQGAASGSGPFPDNPVISDPFANF